MKKIDDQVIRNFRKLNGKDKSQQQEFGESFHCQKLRLRTESISKQSGLTEAARFITGDNVEGRVALNVEKHLHTLLQRTVPLRFNTDSDIKGCLEEDAGCMGNEHFFEV